MEKKSCTNFRGVLISFHEVMKLQGFGVDVSDIISTNA